MGIGFPLSFRMDKDKVLISIFDWLKKNGGFAPVARRWIVEGFARDYPQEYARITREQGMEESRNDFLRRLFPPLNAYHVNQLNMNGVKMPIHRALIDNLITPKEAYPVFVSANMVLKDISIVPSIETAFRNLMMANSNLKRNAFQGMGVEIANGQS
jgi:hypothetical protein